MASHLMQCESQQVRVLQPAKTPTQPVRLLQFVVEGADLPDYWLYLEAPVTATLISLDTYLRKLWLECCGHLSQFEADGTRYVVALDPEWDDPNERSMRGVKLAALFAIASPVRYEYDYGSTTALTLRRVEERIGLARGRGITLLARNVPPPMECRECGAPAISLCSECRWSSSGLFCAGCGTGHACGTDFMLPVVNSPRMGECGYVG